MDNYYLELDLKKLYILQTITPYFVSLMNHFTNLNLNKE